MQVCSAHRNNKWMPRRKYQWVRMAVSSRSKDDNTTSGDLFNLLSNCCALYGFSEWQHDDLGTRRHKPIESLDDCLWGSYIVWPHHLRYEKTCLRDYATNLMLPLTDK